MCWTRDRHVSRVWDHYHWIPHEILTSLHVKHFPTAQSGQKLAKNCTKMKETCRTRVEHVTDTCHVSRTITIGFLAKF